MTKKPKAAFGSLTWDQAAKFWWAVAWRGFIISIIPMAVVHVFLSQASPIISTLIEYIFFIIIYISVQQHVINKIDFQGFELKVMQERQTTDDLHSQFTNDDPVSEDEIMRELVEPSNNKDET